MESVILCPGMKVDWFMSMSLGMKGFSLLANSFDKILLHSAIGLFAEAVIVFLGIKHKRVWFTYRRSKL